MESVVWLAVAHALPALGSLFLLPLHRGRLEMLAAPYLGKYAIGLHALVETPEETVESLSLGQTYFSQLGLPCV